MEPKVEGPVGPAAQEQRPEILEGDMSCIVRCCCPAATVMQVHGLRARVTCPACGRKVSVKDVFCTYERGDGMRFEGTVVCDVPVGTILVPNLGRS